MNKQDNRANYKTWYEKLKGALDSQKYKLWEQECKDIEFRFNNRLDNPNESQSTSLKTRKYGYNLLWSNYKTIMPYLCPYIPNVIVERANKDKDDVTRTACEILERTTQQILDINNFKSEMNAVKTDYLLYGRGILWNRYEANFLTLETGEEVIDEEKVVIEYVNRKDILTNNARVWREVEWVAKKSYFDKNKFKERFPNEDFNKYKNDDRKDKSVDCKIEIWEVWDKTNKQIHWISFSKDDKNVPEKVLESKDDFLKLKNFFPCPSFLTETTDNNSIIPTPDYTEVKSQYDMLDILAEKLYILMELVKVKGWYGGDDKSIPNALSGKDENVLYPVKNFEQYIEKGGMDRMFSWFPIDQIINAINSTISNMEKVGSDIQRLLGIPNIMEGQTNPNEAAMTNKAKGRYGTMRIQERQDKIQMFMRNEIEIVSELISEHFSFDTILKLSDIDKTPDSIFAQQAIQLLENENIRDSKIDIETEGTKGYYDEIQAQQSLLFFNTSIDSFMKASQVVQQSPETFDLMKLYLTDFARQSRKGRSFESTLESTLEMIGNKIKQDQANPEQPKPDPNEQLKNQTKIQELQIKSQENVQTEQIKSQVKIVEIQNDNQQRELDRQYNLEVENAKNAIAQADLIIKGKKVDGDLMLKNKELDAEIEASRAEMITGRNLDTNFGE